jgi:hypothetical protein
MRRIGLLCVALSAASLITASGASAAGGTKLCLSDQSWLPVLGANTKGECPKVPGLGYQSVELGAEGKEGKEGKPGKEGKEGPQGVKGEAGAEGKEGKEGKAGAEGKQGPEGPQGKEGKEGKEGTEGKEGKQGPEGKEGKQGPEGKEGKQGPEGKEGKQGPEGKEGPPGPVHEVVGAITPGCAAEGSPTSYTVVPAGPPGSCEIRFPESEFERIPLLFLTPINADQGNPISISESKSGSTWVTTYTFATPTLLNFMAVQVSP